MSRETLYIHGLRDCCYQYVSPVFRPRILMSLRLLGMNGLTLTGPCGPRGCAIDMIACIYKRSATSGGIVSDIHRFWSGWKPIIGKEIHLGEVSLQHQVDDSTHQCLQGLLLRRLLARRRL